MINFIKKKEKKKVEKKVNKPIAPILIYTEQTPNPDTLKFVTSRILYDGMADFGDRKIAEEWSPFAAELYKFDYVKKLIINKNFVSIDKDPEANWREVMFEVKDFIKKWLEEEKPVVKEGYKEMLEAEWQAKKDSGEINDIEEKIIEIIDQHVKPWIEQDGGGIEYMGFDEGVVTVRLYGACSTCSSASVTLKAGVEQILTSMIPDVKEVAQDLGY